MNNKILYKILTSLSIVTMMGNNQLGNQEIIGACNEPVCNYGITAFVETDVTNENFEEEQYKEDFQYVDDGGVEYSLPYSHYEKVNEGWHGPETFTGFVEFYDAASYMINGKEYVVENGTPLTIEQMEEILDEFGYSKEYYRPVSFQFVGEAYEENGITYRDFEISYEEYGWQYQVWYVQPEKKDTDTKVSQSTNTYAETTQSTNTYAETTQSTSNSVESPSNSKEQDIAIHELEMNEDLVEGNDQLKEQQPEIAPKEYMEQQSIEANEIDNDSSMENYFSINQEREDSADIQSEKLQISSQNEHENHIEKNDNKWIGIALILVTFIVCGVFLKVNKKA